MVEARVTELIATMARASVELTIGQKRDIAFESDSNIDTDSCLQMIAGKTAALTRWATFGGARLALGQTEPSARRRLHAFGDFGHHLGLAFQIRHDVLGLWGSSDETGKPVGGDEKMSRHGQEIYSKPEELNDSDEAEVRAMLDATGAHGYTQGEAQWQAALARQALTAAAGGTAALDANPFLVDLAALANFAIDRRS